MSIIGETNNKNIKDMQVVANFKALNAYMLLIPFAVLIVVLIVLGVHHALNYSGCIALQKPLFYYINQDLLTCPTLEYNLTQLGNAMVFLSFLTWLIVKKPHVWQALVPALIISAILTPLLKKFFAMPRPAAVFNHTTFTIVGPTLMGHNSLPSGHSITIFTIITVLIVAFLPIKKSLRWLWVIVMVAIGLFLALSRVAVGAHHPLDVLVGSCIGAICGILGIMVQRHFSFMGWIGSRRWHLLFIALILICIVVLIKTISNTPLVIYFLSILSLIISLYVIVKDYLGKQKNN